MGRHRRSLVLLAGDIGGTKTTLALYDAADVRRPRIVRTYDSRTARDFDALLDSFLAAGNPPDLACVAAAGPVVAGSVQVTNLPWTVSEERLAERTALGRARLLNDVEALGWAVAELLPEERVSLQKGSADPAGPVAVLALGTGLGQAYTTALGTTRAVHASEGGHADFAPATPLQDRLLEATRRDFPHVSTERLCSGSGLPRIHRFLVSEGWEEDPLVARDIADAADPTPAIVSAGLSGRSPASREAVALLCDLLAAEVGNLALRLLSSGGIFLGGGLPPRLLPFLRADRFRQAFLAKGRMAALLDTMPFHVVLPSESVLWGATLRGWEESDAA